MKRTLIFVDYYDNMAFDVGKEELSKGHEVFFLGCSRSTRLCKCNYGASSLICRLCMHLTRKKFRDFRNEPHCHLAMMDELITPEIIHQAQAMQFSYTDVSELKALQYKGVDIGYGAFSTFVSVTRNVMPSFNDYFRRFIDELLRSEVRMIEAVTRYMEEMKPDLVVFMCGRHANQKPIWQMAEQKGIDYIATEKRWTKEGVDTCNFFYNSNPHDPEAIFHKMQACWESAPADKMQVASAFFYNRRHGLYAGDVIYTTRQEEHALPDDFDVHKTNITIFNSSEDEYFSVSRAYDNSGIWPNQYQALKTIFDHYKHRSDLHFYLRIHPNLRGVNFKSHQVLYSLIYENVTILPPDSAVSSYALMEKSDKVIVFNSTMGLESAYWGKPVVALNLSYYSYMNITYRPKTEQECYDLIEIPHLPSLKNEECLKAAYFIMGENLETFKYYPVTKKSYALGPLSFVAYSQFTCLGSACLMAFILKLLRVCSFWGIIGKFSRIPERTA